MCFVPYKKRTFCSTAPVSLQLACARSPSSTRRSLPRRLSQHPSHRSSPAGEGEGMWLTLSTLSASLNPSFCLKRVADSNKQIRALVTPRCGHRRQCCEDVNRMFKDVCFVELSTADKTGPWGALCLILLCLGTSNSTTRNVSTRALACMGVADLSCKGEGGQKAASDPNLQRGLRASAASR